MHSGQLTAELKNHARRLGFELVGACAAEKPACFERFTSWLASGRAAGMDYLAEQAAAREHPQNVLESARSILMLGMSYRTVAPNPPQTEQGSVARYAWGRDYHDIIHQRLRALRRFHEQLTPSAAVRGVVDTAPLLEREFAHQAGLGWFGRNSLLINEQLGSYFFLAALLTSEKLEYDSPIQTDHCGTCQACIDACPTGAICEDRQVDARRCLSYLTIEHRGAIPDEFRQAVGTRAFGCDACQEACPWNRSRQPPKPISAEAEFFPAEGMNPLELTELFTLDDEGFRRRFRKTPLWRAKRSSILRNAALVLGNQASLRVTEPMLKALNIGIGDNDPVVQAACAWALKQCNR
ncbi:MAG: tRNA epoxyqueuosine(34) reductase QueG [Pirellulales bacterium]|nr:tRNA epoxyqueuosine(34) reductase QueG [Pirellulales bacterium]